MPRLVDLKAAPYNLDDAQVAWVEETLAGMTLDFTVDVVEVREPTEEELSGSPGEGPK